MKISGNYRLVRHFYPSVPEYFIIKYLLSGASGFSFAICLGVAVSFGQSTLASPQTSTSALNGTWKFEYPCAGVTGIYASRCAAGQRDNFSLSIESGKGRLCGWYEITAQQDNHVDDGPLDDWTFTPSENGSFDVTFHMSGNVGKAKIFLNENRIAWRTLEVSRRPEGHAITWMFSPPMSAVLVRQPLQQGRRRSLC